MFVDIDIDKFDDFTEEDFKRLEEASDKIDEMNKVKIDKSVQNVKSKMDIQLERVMAARGLTDKDTRREILDDIPRRGYRPRPPKVVFTKSANIKNAPEKIQAIIERAAHDPQYVQDILIILSKAMQRLTKHAQDHQTFCDYFSIDGDIGKKLCKIFGITEAELHHEMEKAGFASIHGLYKQTYHQALMLVYAIGLYIDDKALRLGALFLISARIYNGKVLKSWKQGCNQDIAKYVQQYLLKKNALFSKFSTPYNFIYNYFVIAKDARYESYIRQDIVDPINGMIKMLKSIDSGLRGVVTVTLAKHYYDAYSKGLKETTSETHKNAYDSGGDMVESKETFKNVRDELIDKFKKNQITSDNILLSPDVKSKLKLKFGLSDKGVEFLNQWFNDEDNHDDLEILAELLVNGFEPQSDEEFCKLPVDTITTRIGNTKMNEHLMKIKKYRELMYREVFGKDYDAKNSTSYRNLNILSYALVLYIKKLICKSI